MTKGNVLTYFTILENRAKKSGLFPVCLVVYFNGTKKRYRTSVELSKVQWKKIKSSKLRDESLKGKRSEIQGFVKKAELAGKKLHEFSFEAFEEEYFKKRHNGIEDVSFEQCTKEFMNEKAGEWSLKTSIMYDTLLNSVAKFKPTLKIKGLTSELIRKYENHLNSDGKSISTIGIYIRQIRAVSNYAIKKKYMLPEKYPFKNYTVPAAQKNKRALGNDEIKALIEYKTDLAAERKAIDFWTFSYLGNGMNFNDIAKLRYSNILGENLKFYRSKTKSTKKGDQKEISIYLLAKMQEIINRWGNNINAGNEYIFPILKERMNERDQYVAIAQFIKTTNKYLKRVTETLNWEVPITTYFARHSYATRMNRTGVPITYISESLGHSNISTTENYLSSFTDETLKKNANLLLDLED